MHGRCKLRNVGICNGERLTFGLSYENVQWNEFDSFAKSCPWLPPRTHPKPDLTYAFPIQISPPGSLQGFAKDELTQTLSVQSLGKLVEQGVTCAPTTALRNKANHSDGSGWSSSDRSCFPWAVVEIKKDVASPRDAAIERCYCQAANAAAAALEIQAQLFKKINDILPLQSPPVVAFTCVGPVVKVWLAYNDKPEFGHPVQVRANHPHLFTEANFKKRMRCIWSTSIRLTWGVVSLRAIVKNMHTWSSRLLKPKLQVAILQASKRLPTKSPPGFHDPPNWCLPTPVVHCSEAVSTDSSSKKKPGISQMFGNSITPEKHNSPVLHLRIDTPTPSKNTDHTSPLRNCQPEAALGARNDSFFGNNNKSAAAGPSTTRTHGLFGQNAGPSTTRTHGLFGQNAGPSTTRTRGLFGQNAPDVFIGPGFDWSLHTATSIGLRSQSATKSGSNLFGGTSTSVARDPGKNTFDADVGSNYVKGGLFGATIGHSATKVNHGERRPSISLAPPDSDGRPVSSTNGISAWGSSRKPGAVSLFKSESSSSSTSGFGSSSKSEFGSSSKLGFGSSSPIPRSSRFGSSSEPVLSSSSKSDCARVDTSKNNDRGGSSSGSSRSNISAPMHTHRKSSVRAARQTDVSDITTAFASTSLGFTSTHHTTLNGATGPGHRHLDKASNKPEKTPNYDKTRRRAK